MKLAFSTNAFTRRTLHQAIVTIGKAGYAGVEILADKPHWYPARFLVSEAERIRSWLLQAGLVVSNVNANCTFGYWKNPPPEPFFEPSLISPQKKLRQARIVMIKNTLQFAAAVGAQNISITSGKALPTMPPERALKQLGESLKPVLELAQKLNIRVGMECEPMLLIEWATELRALIEEIRSPMLGANLDIGHSVVLGEHIGKTLQLLRGRIWNCHIEDIPGRKHYHLIPGQGTMDWWKLRRDLLAIGYNRFLTVELYTYPDRPEEAAKKSLRLLQKIFIQPPLRA
ncbi:MAG TPA: sugar phosphate isomerase/epimerase family protein [Phycisphaerae bacterium]|nr:sugar phosphate isomerase/epimerase family protein [Phycisphaerae bacterium]